MKRKDEMKNQLSYEKVFLEYETEKLCPICKASIVPVYISSSLNTEETASVYNFCPNCSETFVTQYAVKKEEEAEVSVPSGAVSETAEISAESEGEEEQAQEEETVPEPEGSAGIVYRVESVIYSEPDRFVKKDFDPLIENLSPEFTDIYNQSFQAETEGLYKIASTGYRKAMEFLVKDYLIKTNPAKSEKIKKKSLSACIKEIDNSNIKTLAEESSWLGNDEAKQGSGDISELKTFIEALVHYINMDLIFKESKGMKF